MNEHPILFSAPMVRAILEGRKTQTRRVLIPPLNYFQGELCVDGVSPDGYARFSAEAVGGGAYTTAEIACRYGGRGDRLWVRENFSIGAIIEGERAGNSFVHFADSAQKYRDGAYYLPNNHFGQFDPKRYKWKPSIHMPRWACRILLEITDVRVQRLQQIDVADAICEGIVDVIDCDPVAEFAALWDSINAERAPWERNPWVWAITFKKIDQKKD